MTSAELITVTSESKRLLIESPTPLSAKETESLQEAWDQIVQRHPWNRYLPPETGVRMDPQWKGSAGYWASSLRLESDKRVPAVLLAGRTMRDSRGLARTLSHELTHLIQWNVRPQDPGWLREGLALLSEYEVTAELNPAFFTGWNAPTVGLFSRLELTEKALKETWRDMADSLPQYGQLLEFFLYLDRVCFEESPGTLLASAGLSFGEKKAGRDWLWQVVTRLGKPGPEAREAGVCASFDLLFEHFQKARFTQRFGVALEHTFPASGRARAVERPARLPALEPYSAAAYFSDVRAPGVEACLPGEQELPIDPASGRRRCLRIRYAK